MGHGMCDGGADGEVRTAVADTRGGAVQELGGEDGGEESLDQRVARGWERAGLCNSPELVYQVPREAVIHAYSSARMA